MKKIIKYTLLIIWMTIIFLFSNQPATESGKLSNNFLDKTITIFNKDITTKQKEQLIKQYGIKIRKLAHFTIYFILGILMISIINEYNIKNTILISIVLCFLYATSDEIHQLFIAGRSCEFKDVLIDTMGSFIGINIYNLINKKIKNSR